MSAVRQMYCSTINFNIGSLGCTGSERYYRTKVMAFLFLTDTTSIVQETVVIKSRYDCQWRSKGGCGVRTAPGGTL